MTNRRFQSHIFWGYHSPLSALIGAPLIIMASSRLAFALVAAGAIVWVYGFTALISGGARRIIPSRGRKAVLLFLSAFLCGIFMLALSLLNPILSLGTGFFLLLVPPCCLGSGFFEASKDEELLETASRALLEALTLSAVIVALALIREPLGMGTLSLPGGAGGLVELFGSSGDKDGFVPLRVLSVSGGGLLLLGYAAALYRYFKARIGHSSEDDQ